MALSIARHAMRQSRPWLLSTPQLAVGTNSHQIRHGSSDYGSPTGGPISTNPTEQGPNPSADKEHPGPPPPKVGYGTGKSGTKSDADGHQTGSKNKKPTQQPSGGGSSSKRSFSTLRVLHGSDGSHKKPQPKILDEKPPSEAEQSDEVRRHNEEFAKRPETVTERARNEELGRQGVGGGGEKVDKGYWKGDAGHKDGGKKQDGNRGKH